MKKLIFYSLVLFLTYNCGLKAQNDIPLPSNAQIVWHNCERIMFVHWGMATWQNREYDNHSTNLDDVHPSKYSTDQWCEVARSWGATMIIFVAKHAGGFCWWQTNTTDYGVKELKWKDGKADVMKDLSASCKKYGLLLGVYIYPGDDKWGAGIGSGGICEDSTKQEAYNKVFRQQLTEVLSNYGQISEVWFDGNCKIKVTDILEKYAPDAVVFQGEDASLRWVGNEDGKAPYPNWYTLNKEDLLLGNSTALASDVNGNAYAPIEVDVPLLKNKGHKWFWSEGSDSLLLSVSQLMNLYYNSVGRGSTLLLNSTPDTSGVIPESHCKVYKAFGEEINKRFLFPIKFTKGKANFIYLQLRQPTKINHAVIQEDVTFGQRILEYEILGKTNGKWITLSKGTSVGNKRIDFFDDTEVEAVKLNVTASKDTPQIKLFAIYNVSTRLDDLSSYSTLSTPVRVDYWDKNSFLPNTYKEIEIDLTPYAYQTGEYILSFDQLSMDYAINKSSALQFTDVSLEMYGKNYELNNKKRNSSIKQLNASQFLITHSQQTLKNFPIKFHAKIKNSGAQSMGDITLKKVTY